MEEEGGERDEPKEDLARKAGAVSATTKLTAWFAPLWNGSSDREQEERRREGTLAHTRRGSSGPTRLDLR